MRRATFRQRSRRVPTPIFRAGDGPAPPRERARSFRIRGHRHFRGVEPAPTAREGRSARVRGPTATKMSHTPADRPRPSPNVRTACRPWANRRRTPLLCNREAAGLIERTSAERRTSKGQDGPRNRGDGTGLDLAGLRAEVPQHWLLRQERDDRPGDLRTSPRQEAHWQENHDESAEYLPLLQQGTPALHNRGTGVSPHGSRRCPVR